MLHYNEQVQDKGRARVERYYEIIQGKRDLLRTWEEHPLAETEHEYVMELRTTIRKARVLLSHSKFAKNL